MQQDPRIGKTISHYRIIEHLGGGGMGVVYLAEDTRLKRTVALKFLPVNLTMNEESKKRFMIEAQAASALDHPRIGTIFEIDLTEDGDMFIAMAYYPGETLKKRITSGNVTPEEAFNFVQQIANGLAEAHSQGIIHRDIKPANILITKEGYVKIVDFGLAKLGGATQITKSGTSMGTPAYMSPEQVKGLKIDHRADIWALGVILYELLTGELPFKAENDMSMLYNIVNEPHLPFARFNLKLPPECSHVVEKALAKDPDQRYDSIQAFMQDLIPCRENQLRNEDGMATVLIDRKQPSAPAGIPANKTPTSAAKSPKRPLIFALFLVIAVAIVYVTFFRTKETQTGPDSGYVKIESQPAGAQIIVDGKNTDKVAPALLGPLQSGEHKLTLQVEGFEDWEETFIISQNDTASKVVSLTPIQRSTAELSEEPSPGKVERGSLIVRSDPPGAFIYFDGKSTGEKTPATFDQITAGVVHVEYRLNGYEAITKTGHVSANQSTKLFAKLTRGYGTLRIHSRPDGAAIFLNGKPTGKKTPATLAKLSPGDYVVWLQAPDFQTDTASVTIQPKNESELNVTLTAQQPANVKILAFIKNNDSKTMLFGAEIFVDGANFGQTPRSFPIKTGTHRIGAKYFPYTLEGGEQTIELHSGEERKIEFIFVKK